MAERQRYMHTGYPKYLEYDPFLIYDSGSDKKANWAACDERMLSWNEDKYNSSLKEVFNDRGLSNASPKEFESFLQKYNNNDKLELLAVLKVSNQPYWIFCAYIPKEENDRFSIS